jgi:hypothetical protein
MDMTTTNDITTSQIKALRVEAEGAGDLRMAMICVLAIGGVGALEGADPGTEADMLIAEGRTQEWALAKCGETLAYAQGEA